MVKLGKRKTACCDYAEEGKAPPREHSGEQRSQDHHESGIGAEETDPARKGEADGCCGADPGERLLPEGE